SLSENSLSVMQPCCHTYKRSRPEPGQDREQQSPQNSSSIVSRPYLPVQKPVQIHNCTARYYHKKNDRHNRQSAEHLSAGNILLPTAVHPGLLIHTYFLLSCLLSFSTVLIRFAHFIICIQYSGIFYKL